MRAGICVKAFALAIAGSAAAGGINGQETDGSEVDPIDLGFALIEDGSPELACTLVETLFGFDTDEPMAVALAGECHEAQGMLTEAVEFYERYMDLVPEADAVRARIAALQLRTGDIAQSRRALDEGIQAARDDQTRERFTQLAARVDAAEEVAMAELPPLEPMEPLPPLPEYPPLPPLPPIAVALEDTSDMVALSHDLLPPEPQAQASARIAVARVFDTNINNGSSQSTADTVVGGFPVVWTIPPESQAISDMGTQLSAGGGYLHPFDANHAMLLRADLDATIYDTHRDHSGQTLTLGATYLHRNGDFSAQARPHVRFGAKGGEFEEVTSGVDGRLALALNEQLTLSAAGGLIHRTVFDNSAQSSWDTLVAAGAHFSFSPALRAGVDYSIRRSEAGSPVNSNWSHGPQVYLEAAVTDAVGLSLQYGLIRAVYDDSLPLFPQGREDWRHSFGARLDVDLSAQVANGLHAHARYDYSRADSTIGLHQSDRHVVGLGLDFRF